jgi:uncharacterized protein
MTKQFKYVLIPFIFVTCVIASNLLLRFYPDFLWFQSMGYAHIWWFVVKSKATVLAAFFALSYSFIRGNVWLARSISERTIAGKDALSFSPPFEFLNKLHRDYLAYQQNSLFMALSGRAYRAVIECGIIGVSFLLGLMAQHWWQDILSAIHSTPFGLKDPIFNHDISFYFFKLPLFEQFQSWIGLLFMATLAITAWIYFSRNILAYFFSNSKNSAIKLHLFVLIAFVVLGFAFGMQLKLFGLLYSREGSVFGAAYTDVHATMLGYRLLQIAFIAQAAILLIWGFRGRLRVPLFGFLGLIATWLLVGNLYPSFVQSYIVAPNEIQKETPYIQRNIKFTQIAYGLDKIKSVEYPATKVLGNESLKRNKTILNNIPLWNPEPLKQTFKQLQEIRLYYEFSNMDVDRYQINGSLQQVMLSAREMDVSQISEQAQTWVNQHLIYTHGYGAVMSPVHKITDEGLPVFYIKDLPPISDTNIQITRPEIYFGEQSSNYVITNSLQAEFDYPKGSTNEHAHYQGTGGIPLKSFLRRLMFAVKFSDLKFIISQYITGESRLMYDRKINLITQKIAPFLIYDRDPYLVITDEGHMVWMQDAYTVSSLFPYSEPYPKSRLNYIRNSVTVTIDTYNGKPQFYIKEANDPIIQTLSKIYPHLFQPYSAMPADLQRHIRYPKDLFTIQSLMFNTYHMTDPQVFYNREDLWQLPKEIYGEQEQIMTPYYIVLEMPDETKPSFSIMLPFTPTNKNNMIAWLSAKSDLDHYGELTVFKIPKERTIFGPTQIESRIDQDTDISQKLTLWGQMGSRVIRGNLVVIPIDGTLIYAEPIYLQATQSKLPELKRVILAYNNQVVMEPSLEAALDVLISGTPQTGRQSESPVIKPSDTIDKLIGQLIQENAAMKRHRQAGNWTAFGDALKNIDTLLIDIQKYQKKKP